MEQWAEWHKLARQKHKFRYWLAEDGLGYIKDFFSHPFIKLSYLRYYIYNRWIYQSHALVSNLPRGQWQELDTCLLHAAFDELVNFIEVDKAWKHVCCCDDARAKYLRPWYYRVFRLRTWRCPEAGLAYLEWETMLKHDEEWVDKQSPDYNQPTIQALGAQEILALYKWWKHERPKRPDPMEASGLSAYYDDKEQEAKARGYDSRLSVFYDDKTPEDQERWLKMSKLEQSMEEEYENEDSDMLIRLVKIRRSLWT